MVNGRRVSSGRWCVTEPLRFSEIRRACPPVSDRILTKELRELQQCGLISRREYAVVPPKTEYRLTELGNTLRPVMASMADWGLENRAKITEPS